MAILICPQFGRRRGEDWLYNQIEIHIRYM